MHGRRNADALSLLPRFARSAVFGLQRHVLYEYTVVVPKHTNDTTGLPPILSGKQLYGVTFSDFHALNTTKYESVRMYE